MYDLIERNRSGSGPDTPSLSVVRIADVPELLINERSAEQLRKWQERADAIAAQPSLFEDPDTSKPDLRCDSVAVPVQLSMSLLHADVSPSCSGHQQTIVDWEAVALWPGI